MSVSKVTKSIANAIGKETEEALQAIAKKYGMDVSYRGGTYDDLSYSPKIQYSVVSSEGDDLKAKHDWDMQCWKHGFKPEDYKREVFFRSENRTYRLVGFKPRARKHPLVIEAVDNGQRYTCGALYAKSFIDAAA